MFKVLTRGIRFAVAFWCFAQILRWFYAEEDEEKGDQLQPAVVVFTAWLMPLLSPLLLFRAWLCWDVLPHHIEANFVTRAGRWLLTPSHDFDPHNLPPVPDYGDLRSWAMWPGKANDASVHVPPNATSCAEHNLCGKAGADIFYFHPTMFYSSQAWNAPHMDPLTVFMVETAVGPQQGCAFNGAGRMFAPRYRQMCAASFLQEEGFEHKDAKKALEVAFSDAKSAFQHYLEHEFTPGRGIILAGHSQGSLMVEKLVEEFFQNDPVMARELVAAYVIGWTTFDSKWERQGSHVHVCEHAKDTGCVISFRTYGKGADPTLFLHVEPPVSGDKPVCTNPLSWERDGGYRPASDNLGYLNVYDTGTMFNFVVRVQGRERVSLPKPWPYLIDAECVDGHLFITEPARLEAWMLSYGGVPVHHFAAFPGLNFHTFDLNFFYTNIRRNAIDRTKAFRYKYT